MIFWRKKKNIAEQEEEEKQDRIVHRPNDPEIEPPTEYEAEMTPDQKHDFFEETEEEIIEDLEPTPVPYHSRVEEAQEQQEETEDEDSGGWLGRLKEGLSKSSRKIGQGISDIVTKKKLDQDTLDQLEELLITADLGPQTASKIVSEFAGDRFGKEIDEAEIREALAEKIDEILTPAAKEQTFEKPAEGGPFVMLVCGVNGVGKTTTIGKIAYEQHVQKHRPVMIAAGDTFRAAAVEQLDIWARRAHCPLVKKEVGADSAAVAYEAYEKAKQDGAELLLLDTAGRLHNKKHLMDELQKVVRVLKKQNENLPHAVLLVLDATTGQNAREQVKTFRDIANVDGLAVTKLDGSARGGIVVSLADEFSLPINFVGVGEKEGDLQPFHPREFARSLVGLGA